MEVRPPTPTMVVSELLTENNYKRWRVQMKSYLSSEGLWDIVSGEELLVLRSSGEWTRKNDAALHAIQISCGTEAFSAIDTTSSAKDAWEILRTSFSEYGFEDKGRAPTFQDSELLERSQTISLINAIRKGDFHEVKEILNPGACWGARISENGYTALHVAISTGQQQIAKCLIEEMSPEQLEIGDKKKRTALALAAYQGKEETAQRLIDKHRGLLYIKDSEGNIPLLAACKGGHVEMTRFLWDELMKDYGQGNDEENKGLMNDAASFLQASIKSKMFDIAMKVLQSFSKVPQSFPKVGFENLESPYLSLSEIPSAFFGGNRLVFWQRWIYKCIRVSSENSKQGILTSDDNKELNLEVQDIGLVVQGSREEIERQALETAIHKIRKCLILLLNPGEHIYELKLTHNHAFGTLHGLCLHLSNLKHSGIVRSGAVQAMFNAIKNGNFEFVTEIIKTNPDIIWMLEERTSRDILMCAIAYRQKEIASFIHEQVEWRDVKIKLDKDGNNPLHIAGKLAPDIQLSRISDAGLQMQRELQWFKEVESIVPEYYKECKNDFRKTPGEVFTEEHKDLQRKAEDWMKQTAGSYTIVGALIITMMFAAALTIPDDKNQDTGFPIFSYETLFVMFIISDAVSLSAASTSVLAFLGILTSRYSEKDFLISLPRRLIIGLSTLFMSIAVMMICFAAGVAIMLRGQLWIIIVMSLLTCIPVFYFAFLHFPLLVKTCNSTYRWKVFRKKRD
ncbi:hypothetical protein SLA2020_151210 [Shorea laevis]